MRAIARFLVLPASLALFAGGCVQQSKTVEHPPRASGEAVTPRASTPKKASRAEPRIILDGNMSDWPADTVVWGDANYLYCRFAIEGSTYTLQHHPTPTCLLIDVDGNKETGRHFAGEGLDALGVDLQIIFSPASTKHQGVKAYTIDAAGNRAEVSPYAIDLACAPSVASAWYECRLARSAEALASLPEPGLRSSGRVGFVAVTLDASGNIDGYSDPAYTTLAQAGAPASRLIDATIPAKPANAVRVMAYNIEHTTPASKPETFSRLIQAINPDVVVFEEWELGDADALKGWLTAYAPVNGGDWSVVKPVGNLANGGGVAIATRHSVSAMIEHPKTSAQNGKPVRFVAGRVTTPVADLLVGAVHLKCCGYAGSGEDQQRVAEAAAINELFLAAANQRLATADDSTKGVGRQPIRLIAGDFNLVGSNLPLERIVSGLDPTGENLAVATPLVLGDTIACTWGEASEPFAPGRLDYVLYSSSNADLANAFILDTRRLTDGALARMGLDRNDSAGSDHLPVVVDLVAK